MDWVERLFRLSPDAGSGTFELGIVAGASVAAAMITVSVVGLLPRAKRWYQAVRERFDGASRRPLDRFDG